MKAAFASFVLSALLSALSSHAASLEVCDGLDTGKRVAPTVIECLDRIFAHCNYSISTEQKKNDLPRLEGYVEALADFVSAAPQANATEDGYELLRMAEDYAGTNVGASTSCPNFPSFEFNSLKRYLADLLFYRARTVAIRQASARTDYLQIARLGADYDVPSGAVGEFSYRREVARAIFNVARAQVRQALWITPGYLSLEDRAHAALVPLATPLARQYPLYGNFLAETALTFFAAAENSFAGYLALPDLDPAIARERAAFYENQVENTADDLIRNHLIRMAQIARGRGIPSP